MAGAAVHEVDGGTRDLDEAAARGDQVREASQQVNLDEAPLDVERGSVGRGEAGRVVCRGGGRAGRLVAREARREIGAATDCGAGRPHEAQQAVGTGSIAGVE